MQDQTTKFHYSEKYSDDLYEYRLVTLPRPLISAFRAKRHNGELRCLAEAEWRELGVK